MTELPLALDLPDASTPGRPVHLVSWGLGVESTAYLVEVLTSQEHYGLDLADLIVLHAVVGSEWRSTLADAEVGNPGYQNPWSSLLHTVTLQSPSVLFR
ncbi:hypothetical protein ACIA5G_51265 [Amycolatopsis sp. NPDC051758]|uniref:hypothetical protein n=1 Tax=Amycolatopsis sp. NPDC051758 TaxID=3363935 RepID=UPI00378C84D4